MRKDTNMSNTAVQLPRRVRITLEADARTVSLAEGHEVLRAQYAGGVVLVRTGEDVTVEDLPTVRTWTDGDVVAGETLAYQRRGGKWRGVSGTGLTITLEDADVTAATEPGVDGALDVLRYQAAGEDPAA